RPRFAIGAVLIALALMLTWRPLWADEPASDEETPVATEENAAVTEVLVRGQRPAPAAARLTREESKQMPGALADPFRAIEAMPGVTPIASALPYFFVRGAPPGNVGYFFDGIRLPLLFHVFFGPSVIHPAMIQKVDLYRGGYPAEYGRFAGGIV